MQSPNLHAAPHSLMNVVRVRGAQWPPKTFFAADGGSERKREIKRKEGWKCRTGYRRPSVVRLLGRLRSLSSRRCSNGAFGPTAKIEVSSPDDVRACFASQPLHSALQPTWPIGLLGTLLGYDHQSGVGVWGTVTLTFDLWRNLEKKPVLFNVR